MIFNMHRFIYFIGLVCKLVAAVMYTAGSQKYSISELCLVRSGLTTCYRFATIYLLLFLFEMLCGIKIKLEHLGTAISTSIL